FVRYWLHCAHLLVDNQKMSKSLGNFYTLPDVIGKGYSGRELRYAVLRVHYRVPLNFTWIGMEEARQALARIDEWRQRLAEVTGSQRQSNNIIQPRDDFSQAMDDDLNISAALGYLFEVIRQTNSAVDANELGAASAPTWLDWWKKVYQALAVAARIAVASPEELEVVAHKRTKARRPRSL